MTGNKLEQIYNAAYKAVYWTAMSLLRNEADAEDVVQDAFSFESVHICAYPDGTIFNMACQVGHGDWKLSGSLDGGSTREEILEFYDMDPRVNEDFKMIYNCYVGDDLQDVTMYFDGDYLFEVGLTGMS